MHQRGTKLMSGLLTGVFLLATIFSGYGFEVKEARAELADHLVINEINVDSVSGTGGAEDDWIELYNPTESTIDLSNWSIQKTTGTGSSWSKLSLSGNIPANSYFLIVRNHASTTASLIALADASTTSSFSLSNGNILYLVNDDEKISSTTDPSLDENIIDFVGFGSADFYEGSAAALSIPETKSISRNPDGNDTDDNFLNFQAQDPTPRNSSWPELEPEPEPEPSDDLGGRVLITIAPDNEPVQNISATGADLVFQVNDLALVAVNYGLNDSYESSTEVEQVTANSEKVINLSGLTCGTVYHYEIYAENLGKTESDQTADATFSTLPCGINIDSLTMTKTAARANDKYSDGWNWKFDITVWDLAETSLKMKFNQWTGVGLLSAGGNMQYSVDNGYYWVDIDTSGAYPSQAVNIEEIDNAVSTPGRQVEILVRMKVPFGTSAGYYNSGYGILTE